MKNQLIIQGLIRCLLGFCLPMSISGAEEAVISDETSANSGAMVNLLEFEKFHYKLVKVVQDAGGGLIIRYLGATSMNSQDRSLEFIKFSGSCCWALKRDNDEGIDPAREVARIVLLSKPIEGSQKVFLGEKSYWLTFYKNENLEASINEVQLLKNIGNKINSFRIEGM